MKFLNLPYTNEYIDMYTVIFPYSVISRMTIHEDFVVSLYAMYHGYYCIKPEEVEKLYTYIFDFCKINSFL